MSYGPALLLCGFCAAFCYAVARWLIANSGLTRVDVPDERRLHKEPTPRGGGIGLPIAVCLVSLPAAFWLWPEQQRAILWCVFGAALPLGVLGAIDDYKPLRSRTKFLTMFGVAGVFVGLGYHVDVLHLAPAPALPIGWFGYVFSAFWVVWATNVYNFMDGMDALATACGAIFFVALAIFAAPGLSVICLCAAAGLAGFLVLNRPPARIFMGDSGALFIGALLGAVVLVVGQSEPEPGQARYVPLIAPIYVLAPFLWDATYTLFYRIVKRENWLHPHRRHLFQRLVLSDWPQPRVRAIYVGLSLLMACGALSLPRADLWLQATVLIAGLGALITLSVVTERVEAAALAQTTGELKHADIE